MFSQQISVWEPQFLVFYTYYLTPQTYCLNIYLDLFPVIGFQNFIALWKAFNGASRLQHFCKEILHRFVTNSFNGNNLIFSFSLIHIQILIFCLFEFAGSWAFQKLCNLLHLRNFFAHFFQISQLIFKFVQICHFLLINLSRAQGHSKNVSNIIDLYHYKKMGGGSRLNRVKHLFLALVFKKYWEKFQSIFAREFVFSSTQYCMNLENNKKNTLITQRTFAQILDEFTFANGCANCSFFRATQT